MMKVEGYHETRFQYDARRAAVWKTLIEEVFQKMVPAGGTVLELGAGFCDFINQITAAKKIAIDLWPQLQNYAGSDVQAMVGSVTNLDFVKDGSIDLVFASNLFEHLEKDEISECLKVVKRKLLPSGRIVILQPNFRYAYKEYFDDYTHKTIWSDISIADFLKVNGFEVIDVQPRFLPLTMKTRLPQWPFLIKLYLMAPFKPMGKQMLITAQPARVLV